MPFFSIDVWTIIFTWMNLIILVLIMSKFLVKPVKNILARRENEVGEMYKKAEEAQKNAEKMESEYTNKLSHAKEEASSIMKEATREASIKSEAIVSEAQKKAQMALEKAEKQIEQEKKAAVSEIKSDIASIAISVAEKVIEKDINESDYERLVEEFIGSRGETK